jgi:F-type H+-transporting ATPase subunit b
MELIKTFGIEWKLLIAQIINFFVLFFLLKHYAYKPILKMLEDRKDKIEKGLQDAEASQKKLVEIETKEKAVLTEARKQAQEIIAKAEEVAVKNKEEIIVAAKEQSEKILADSAKKIETEKALMFQEVKKQVAELVIAATGKIIDEKIDSQKDKEIIEKAIK